MSRNMTVKLSPYERAINRLNDLPVKLDRIFSDALEDLRRERDEARAALRTVAERQREACAGNLGDWLGMLFHNADGGQSPIPHAEIEAIRRMVRATPLVTEGEP